MRACLLKLVVLARDNEPALLKLAAGVNEVGGSREGRAV